MLEKTFSQVLSESVGKLVNLKLFSGETIEGRLHDVGKDYCTIARGERIELFNMNCVSRCIVTEEPKKYTRDSHGEFSS